MWLRSLILLALVVGGVLMLASCADSPEVATSTPTKEIPTIESIDEEPQETALDSEPDTPIDEVSVVETQDSTSQTPTPLPSGLMAVVNSGDVAGVGKPFTFDATQPVQGDYPITAYEWNMGDGTISTALVSNTHT